MDTRASVPVLVVDDEADMRASVAQWLGLGDFDPIEAESGKEALTRLSPDFPGVVISDVRMPEMDGMALLSRIRAIDPQLPVILVTGHGDVPMAVEAMRNGAYDFLEKPFSPERLLDLLRRAAEARHLTLENRALRRRLDESTGIEHRLIGASPAMQRLREDVLDFARTEASVLITGETGSGKELIARSLHDFSPRASGPFVAVNCAAIPETLIEAELFGHEAGAFTGAVKARPGHFEAAHGGTLFLDEVTSLPAHLQPKLLRALQEREITRLGARKPVPVDIRLVSATNEDIAEAVAEGRIRQDLLYRLNAITIVAPPLRMRGEDAPMLFEVFARRFAATYASPVPDLTPADIAALKACRWPGNVRELMNIAERAVLMGRRGPVEIAALIDGREPSPEPAPVAEGATLRDRVEAFEKQIIEAALRRHQGSIAETMEELGLPRRTLNEKMARYGLMRGDYT